MSRIRPCLLLLALLAPHAQATEPAPLDFAQAKALADRDEAALAAEAAMRIRQAQSAALDEGVAACAMPSASTEPFIVVVRLDAQGAVTASWRKGDTPLAVCVEKFLRKRTLPAPASAPLYLSYELSFVP